MGGRLVQPCLCTIPQAPMMTCKQKSMDSYWGGTKKGPTIFHLTFKISQRRPPMTARKREGPRRAPKRPILGPAAAGEKTENVAKGGLLLTYRQQQIATETSFPQRFVLNSQNKRLWRRLEQIMRDTRLSICLPVYVPICTSVIMGHSSLS